MVRLLYAVTILCAVLGFVALIGGQVAANGAPQQAVVAAVGVGLAVIPYVIARSVQLSSDSKRAAQRHDELLAAMRALSEEREIVDKM